MLKAFRHGGSRSQSVHDTLVNNLVCGWCRVTFVFVHDIRAGNGIEAHGQEGRPPGQNTGRGEPHRRSMHASIMKEGDARWERDHVR